MTTIRKFVTADRTLVQMSLKTKMEVSLFHEFTKHFKMTLLSGVTDEQGTVHAEVWVPTCDLGQFHTGNRKVRKVLPPARPENVY